MPMNFFEDQAQAKKRTTLLVCYFLIAVILTVILINIIVVGAIVYTRIEHYFVYVHGEWVMRRENLYPLISMVSMIASPIVLGIIVLGSLITSYQLRGGGLAVAKMVQARAIHPDTTDPKEKRFINVVEEMSIASGVPVPNLFVMDNEESINAFVSGFTPEDTVMVASKGALDKLSRQELQSVVGHEYSHIFHNDMTISLRLMGITAGLLIIGKIGSHLLRSTFYTRGSRRGSSRSGGGGAGRMQLAFIIIGLGILVVGLVGLLFGRLMKAAVSRQRELLADASSVAYTRNPEGLVYALRRIDQDKDKGHLQSVNAEDVSHFCFSPALSTYLSGAFATHPPIEQRIKKLDPKGQYADQPLPNVETEAKPKAKQTSKAQKSAQDFMRTMMGATILAGAADRIHTTTKAIHDTIGAPQEEHITLGQSLYEQIPASLNTIAHQPKHVAYLWYAMMLPKSIDNKLHKRLASYLPDEKLKKILSIQKVLFNMEWGSLLPLAQIAIPTFKANSQSEKDAILEHVGDILSHTKPHYFQYGLYALLAKATNQNKPKKVKRIYDSLAVHLKEIQIVLSVLVHYSGNDHQDLQAQYQKSMYALFGKSADIGKLVEPSPFVFQAALAKLNQLSPQSKEKFINACFDCIEEDHMVTVAEADLVRVIASILDCPIPPIIRGKTPHG